MSLVSTGVSCLAHLNFVADLIYVGPVPDQASHYYTSQLKTFIFIGKYAQMSGSVKVYTFFSSSTQKYGTSFGSWQTSKFFASSLKKRQMFLNVDIGNVYLFLT